MLTFLSLSYDQFCCNFYIFLNFFVIFIIFYIHVYIDYRFLFSSFIPDIIIIIVDIIIIIRYYYCNCRFNARSYFERALVLLDDNVVK